MSRFNRRLLGSTLYGAPPVASQITTWCAWSSNGTIKASQNVSSVTRVSAGVFTITFANPYNSADYVVSGICDNAQSTAWSAGISSMSMPTGTTNFLTGSCRVTTEIGGVAADSKQNGVLILGAL